MSNDPTPRTKRLVVCFDGTWNKQDDGTNVLHVFNRVVEGVVTGGTIAGGIEQRRYYDQGVGTGVLDGTTGGAFGIGLEQNVREAVNWLVANYDDGDALFVFGFSRGAFTARSLVAFLAVCGIPRRGAPLTVNQLWEGYCLHGRADDGRRNWWEKLVGEAPLPFRNVSNLVRDDWRDTLPPDEWRHTHNYKPWREPQDCNPTETVLQHWTRRPPIAFLGLFDTVGSLGVDALAIPGLRGRLATHHNMRLHSTVGSARHALAIDEHRTNFAETPLAEWVPQGATAIDFGGAIEQRWFVGAHSNIGGGYPSNVLAGEPLAWLLDGAAAQGLVLRPSHEVPPPGPEQARQCLRDSYREFGAIWGHVLRAKRHYRRIAPPAEARGSHGETPSRGGRKPHAMRPIGDRVADSVWQLAAATSLQPPYAPPNLVEYARRNELPQAADLAARCRHAWLGRGLHGGAAVTLWATLAVIGALHAPQLFAQRWPALPAWPWLALAGALLVLLDWSESRLNHLVALHPERGARSALRDVAFWLRATAVVGALLGGVVTAWTAWCLLPVGTAAPFSLATLGPWLAAAAGAAAMVAVLHLERTHRRPAGASRASWWMLVVVLAGVVAVPLAARAACGQWFGWWSPQPFDAFAPASPTVALAGGLLLLEVLLLLMLQSLLSWVSEPLQDARLGSIVTLQRCATAAMVQRRLEQWRQSLFRQPMPGDPPHDPPPERRAAIHVQHCLEHALWRDTLGFVPLYFLLFVVASWFAHTTGICSWLWEHPAAATWCLLPPLGIAALDLVENLLHAWFVRRFAAGRSIPAWAAPISALATLGKAVGFVAALVGVHVAIFVAAWRLLRTSADGDGAGWRGALAVLLAAAIGIALLGQILVWVRELFAPAQRRDG